LMSSVSDLRKQFNQRKLIKAIHSRSPSPAIGRPPSHSSSHSGLSSRNAIRIISTANTSGELALPQNRDQLLRLFRSSTSMSSPRRLVSPVPLTYRQSAAALLCDRISKYYFKHINRWKRFVQASKAAEQEMTSFKRASQIRISVSSKSPSRLVQLPKSASRSISSGSFKKKDAWEDISFRNEHQVSADSKEIAGLFKELNRRKQSKGFEFDLKVDPETPRHMRYLSPLKDNSPPLKNISHISKASEIKQTTADDADDVDNWSEMSPEATVSFLQDSLRGAGISCLASAMAALLRQRTMLGFHCIYIKYTRSVAASAQLSYLTKLRLKSLKVGFEALKSADSNESTKDDRMLQSLLRQPLNYLPRQAKTFQVPRGVHVLASFFEKSVRAAWVQLKLHKKILKKPGQIIPAKAKGRYANVVHSIDGPIQEPKEQNQKQTRLKNCIDIFTRHSSKSLKDLLQRWRSIKSYDMPLAIVPIKQKDQRGHILAQALTRLRVIFLSRLQVRLFNKLKQQGSTSQLKVKALQILLKNLQKDARFRRQVAFEQWKITVRQDEADVLRAIAMGQMLMQLRQVRKLSFLQCLKAAMRKVKKVVDIRDLFKLSEKLQVRRLNLAFLIWKSKQVQKPKNIRGGVAILGALKVILRKRIDPLFKNRSEPEFRRFISRVQSLATSKLAGSFRKLTTAGRVLKSFSMLTNSYYNYSKLQVFSSWRSVKAKPRKYQVSYLNFILNSLSGKSKGQAWQRLKYFAVKKSFSIKSRQQAVRSFVSSCYNSLSKTKSFTLSLWQLRSKEESHLESLEIVLRSWVEKRVQKGVIKSWNQCVSKMKRVTRGLELIGKMYRWRLDDYFQTFATPTFINFSDSPLRTPPRMSVSRQSQVISLMTIGNFATKQGNLKMLGAIQLWKKGSKPKSRRFSNKFVLATITKLTRLSEFVKIKRKELVYWAYTSLKSGRRLNKRQTSLIRTSIVNWNHQISTNSRRVLECFRLWKRMV